MIYVDRNKIPIPYLLLESSSNRFDLEIRNRLENTGKYKQARYKANHNILQKLRPDLEQLFNGKCCYCESRIERKDVDHFRPKSSVVDDNKGANDGYYWLTYKWFNLYLSCTVCNRYKSNYFPVKGKRLLPPNVSTYLDYEALKQYVEKEEAMLIDPCDPRAHETLNFKYDADGSIIPQNEKAEYSIQFFGLNREDLVKNRKELINYIKVIISYITFTSNHSNHLKDLLGLLDEKSAFLGLSRQYIAEWYVANKKLIFSEYPDFNKEFLKALENNIPSLNTLTGITELEVESSIHKQSIKSPDLESKTKFLKFIDWIEIKNFKCIDEMTLKIDTPIEGKGENSILLIGENGVGKSTVLQAIALAMIGQEQLNKLNLGKLSNLIRRNSRARKATIRVKFNDDDIVEVVITKKEITTNRATLVKPTVGIGSIRRLPEKEESVTFNSDPSRIMSLFRHDVIYPDIQPWLGNTELVDTDQFNEAAKTIIEMLMIPTELIGKERLLNRKNGKLTINIGNGPESINSLCDGYRSVIAYALYIMRSFSVHWSSTYNAEGIVIIDEIGNHLHPTWKIRVVSLLRALFPRTMFIISTHDPLCLRSARPGEVWVMNKDEETNDIVINQRDIPPGMPIEDLLLGNWFKMETTLDESTLNIINKHNSLMLENKNTNKAEIKDIESQLEDRMKYVGGQGLFKSFVKTMDSVLEDTDEAFDKSLMQKKIQEKLERKLKH
ncbi:AAA family ATPase [Pontimicrobium sp. SW4]|uniref:AAA family ATPase n=1 Tax=Pontimicrobium sp. SW4 TaxID=3153519 RepID=A0AAU7BQ64_9FLAO